MWCRSCRQDVPGLADGLDGRLACPRCSAVLLTSEGLDLTQSVDAQKSMPNDRVETSAYSAHEADPYESPVFEPVRPATTEPSRVTTLRWDAANWELNEKLRHVERVTASARLRFDAPPTSPLAVPPPPMSPAAWQPSNPASYRLPYPPASPSAPVGMSPYSAPQSPAGYAAPQTPSGPFAPPPYPPEPPAQPPAHYEWNGNPEDHWDTPSEIIASLTMWLFMGAAVIAFSCGGFLAAWGGIAERNDLRSMSMPVIIVGIGLLVIGLLPRIFLKQIEEEDRKRLRAMQAASQNAVPPHHLRRANQHAPHERNAV